MKVLHYGKGLKSQDILASACSILLSAIFYYFCFESVSLQKAQILVLVDTKRVVQHRRSILSLSLTL